MKATIFLTALLLMTVSAKSEPQSAVAAFNPDDTIKSVETTLKPLIDAVAKEDRAYEARKRFEVTAYGAVADGTTKNTQAIQKAIDACSAAGGGRVHFTKGDYLTGTIFLKAGAVLDLDEGARILGSTDLADYPSMPAKFNALYRTIFTQCLIYAEKADGVGIRGKGEIDMRGGEFHGPESNGALTGRPFMIRMTECNNVRIEGITLRRSASWMQHYLACDNLVIRNLKVQNFSNVNCDGADIDGCKNVWIARCHLASVDDCLCFKGTSTRPTENVLVEDSRFYSNCNAIKMGTDSQGLFRNALFRRLDIGGADDSKVEDLAESNTHKNVVNKRKSRTGQSSGGITWQAVDGMAIENIVVTDCVVSRARAPLFMRLGDRGRFITGDPRAPAGAKCKAKVRGGQLEPMGWRSPVGSIRNVAFINITGEHNGNFGCSALGIPGHRIENVIFKNIKLGVAGGGTQADAARISPERPAIYPDPGVFMKQPAHGIYFRHVNGAVVENAEFKTKSPDARPVFAGSDALNIKVDGKPMVGANAIPPATDEGEQAALPKDSAEDKEALAPVLPAADSSLNSPEAVDAYQVKDPQIIAIARKLLATPDSAITDLTLPNPHPDAQWFPQAGLGLFMHWGIHSVVGAQPSWSMIGNYRWAGSVKLYPPEKKYFPLAKRFHPDQWNPDKWLKPAEDAGFTYAVLTTKHHDGYALWPSAFGNFSTKQYLDGRDLLQPYVDACRKHHLKVGFYFSPRDWHYPNFPLLDVDFNYKKRGQYHPIDPKVNQARFEEFFTYTIGQLHELLTRYGKIDVLWFDGMKWNGVDDMHTNAVYQWIRTLQPGIVINDRWSKIRNPDDPEDRVSMGDFLTVECRDAAKRPSGWWESCNIWNYAHWGYDRSEGIRSLEWTLDNLVRCRRWGGNYLPDLGPRPDGEMPRGFYKRCEELRVWMSQHRESVIGTTPLPDDRIANVPVTCRKNIWYLHISPSRKRNTPITIQTNNTVQKAFVLGTGKPVTIQQDKGALSLNPPDGQYREVIVIVFKEE